MYIDLAFYQELRKRFGAPGDFAQAYVIAHEIGHHVQKLLGFTDKVHSMQGRVSKDGVQPALGEAGTAGGLPGGRVGASRPTHQEHPGRGRLGGGAALRERHRRRPHPDAEPQGYVVPDGFTHGTSEQRLRWFRKGFDTGDISQGDTFSAREL